MDDYPLKKTHTLLLKLAYMCLLFFKYTYHVYAKCALKL